MKPDDKSTEQKPPVSRGSWRLDEFAERHRVSVGFLYKEAAAKRLRIRKAGAVSLVTPDAEVAWFATMPILGEPVDKVA
jgi:hypothetical protein